MNSTENIANEKKYNKWIVVLSIVIPVAVAALFGVNLRELGFDVQPLTFLPPIYASINALTALVLVVALIAVLNKKVKLHERLMKFAILLSVSFLLLYIAYHTTSDSTKFGGEGVIKYIYYFILFTHIVLSVVVIPFVLITYVRAISGNFERHKKIAKVTFPLWLYVAVTGVVIYIMISPYYT
ncbi:DUF420 domain-containing protein [Bizionia gelidisalsuginis]|uniref:DUF420 domain-containing protein n=2 Tax=Bizionia TaxID=283785 RepID=A0A8H2LDQ2_9FLAO|nr:MULTISPECIES: DUF420 domain-containing protein [Bizionia]TYB72200.1 DUF420 domain-containing protein [Bizionia saleffrena]TYC10696.1 DUF420 domain-containing protein [Bizionia gelidisalsuginis]